MSFWKRFCWFFRLSWRGGSFYHLSRIFFCQTFEAYPGHSTLLFDPVAVPEERYTPALIKLLFLVQGNDQDLETTPVTYDDILREAMGFLPRRGQSVYGLD